MAQNGILCVNGKTRHRNTATRDKCRLCKQAKAVGRAGTIGAAGHRPDLSAESFLEVLHPDSSGIDTDSVVFGARGKIVNREPNSYLYVENSTIDGELVLQGLKDIHGNKPEDLAGSAERIELKKLAHLYLENSSASDTTFDRSSWTSLGNAQMEGCTVDGGANVRLLDTTALSSSFSGNGGVMSYDDGEVALRDVDLEGRILGAGGTTIEDSDIRNNGNIGGALRFKRAARVRDSRIHTKHGIGDIVSAGLPTTEEGKIDISGAYGIDYKVIGPDGYPFQRSSIAIPAPGQDGKTMFVTGDGANHEYRLMGRLPEGQEPFYVYHRTHFPEGQTADDSRNKDIWGSMGERRDIEISNALLAGAKEKAVWDRSHH